MNVCLICQYWTEIELMVVASFDSDLISAHNGMFGRWGRPNLYFKNKLYIEIFISEITTQHPDWPSQALSQNMMTNVKNTYSYH